MLSAYCIVYIFSQHILHIGSAYWFSLLVLLIGSAYWFCMCPRHVVLITMLCSLHLCDMYVNSLVVKLTLILTRFFLRSSNPSKGTALKMRIIPLCAAIRLSYTGRLCCMISRMKTRQACSVISPCKFMIYRKI